MRKYTDNLIQFFEYDHLPEKLQKASRSFCMLAREIHDTWPQNPETTVSMRKLLEAKDAAVRAIIFK
jgi:hypothetical protein